MIFNLKENKSKFIEKSYKDSMKELNDFYEINWINNTPNIYIIKSRKNIDSLRGKKTESWIVGWVNRWSRTVYLLENDKMEKESSHKKYSKQKYSKLVKHELGHLFFGILVRNGYSPKWLWEGVSIYTSSQYLDKKIPQKFSEFLIFSDIHKKDSKSVYGESGFFIKILVEEFGKEKLLNFLKSLQKIKDKKEFKDLFYKTYKFNLNYREINKIYKDSNNS